MPRFFVEKESIKDGRAVIVGDDSRHIARSLRMAEGEEITICDGSGDEFICQLEKIRDEACECRIICCKKGESEPPYELVLFMAYPKGDKLETVIQKAVELGATAIIPFESSRCIKRPDEKKSEARLPRLQKIAEEAAKQCGRARIPTVSIPLSYSDMLKEASAFPLALFCYEDEAGHSIKDCLSKLSQIPSGICAVVGSEGGFSKDEAAAAADAGLTLITLGKRILRCETAPDYVLSAISYHFEL